MKNTILLLLFILLYNKAYTQSTNDSTLNSEQTNVIKPKYKDYGNSVQFSWNNFYIPNNNEFAFERFHYIYGFIVYPLQIGVYYERKTYKNINISIGYNEWNTLSYFENDWGGPLRIRNFKEPFKPGLLLERSGYKTIDFYTFYKYNHFKKHKINIGIGATYTYGQNDYIDSIHLNNGPPFDAIIYTSVKNESYYGILAALSYNYLCLKNRMSIGLDIRYRKYFKLILVPEQIDWGYHISFNF